jgi:ABC-type lipoprotein release transport system permease subunit
MRTAGVLRVVGVDLRRHAGRLAAAAAGVTVAVAALTFFLALALGVRQVLLGEVFPIDRVEVAPESRPLDLLALRFELGGDTLSAEQLDSIGELEGVAGVFPKIRLAVPALASGGESLLGTSLQTELVADGIDPELVSENSGGGFSWKDAGPAERCASSRDCSEGWYCGDGVYGTAGLCRPYVPVLLSNHLLEMYNGSFRQAYGLPRLNPDFAVGLEFEMAFGASTLRPSRRLKAVRERMRIAGFSDKAIPLGVTLPLEFVRRVNRSFGMDADAYHSAIVTVGDRAAVPRVVEALRTMGLVVKDSGAERAATLMAVVMAMVAMVGGAMVVVATISVGHAFFMVVLGRRREIGVLRAVGARRADVRWLVLCEAAVLGLVAGGVGASVAGVVARLADRMAANRLPDFPYKPETFFLFPWWLVVGAVCLAVAACAAGAIAPAVRAVARDPADVLTAR